MGRRLRSWFTAFDFAHDLLLLGLVLSCVLLSATVLGLRALVFVMGSTTGKAAALLAFSAALVSSVLPKTARGLASIAPLDVNDDSYLEFVVSFAGLRQVLAFRSNPSPWWLH